MEPRTRSTESVKRLRREREIKLPSDVMLLEEANLPSDLAMTLAGKDVKMELVWEKGLSLRRAEPWDTEILIDPAGSCWSEYQPLQILFKESGRTWRFPRRWAGSTFDWLQSQVPMPDSEYRVARPHTLSECLHMPSFWDLLEINIPRELATRAAGQPTEVLVRFSPVNSLRVTWIAPTGISYVVPCIWRRRRVRLPDSRTLMTQGVAADIAERYAERVMSVNFHPGSLCCNRDYYRFRDEDGVSWPVKIWDCVLIGYGDAEERRD